MTYEIVISNRRWVRSRNGLVAGVCEGLGQRWGVEPWLLRAGLLVAVLAFGTGLALYAILAFCLPREDKAELAERKKLLGVCRRLAQQTGLEVGLVRALAVLLALVSFGAAFVGYLVLHFVMPPEHERLVY